jgi:hypothetical protein
MEEEVPFDLHRHESRRNTLKEKDVERKIAQKKLRVVDLSQSSTRNNSQ